MINSSSPSTVTSVPDHLPNKIVAIADRHCDQFAAVFASTLAASDYNAFSRLFFCTVWNDQSARSFFIAFKATDQNAVVKRF
jgi:nucleoside recognition membrane protein YjiH